MSLIQCLPKSIRVIMDKLMKFLIQEARLEVHFFLHSWSKIWKNFLPFTIKYICFDLEIDSLCKIRLCLDFMMLYLEPNVLSKMYSQPVSWIIYQMHLFLFFWQSVTSVWYIPIVSYFSHTLRCYYFSAFELVSSSWLLLIFLL